MLSVTTNEAQVPLAPSFTTFFEEGNLHNVLLLNTNHGNLLSTFDFLICHEKNHVMVSKTRCLVVLRSFSWKPHPARMSHRIARISCKTEEFEIPQIKLKKKKISTMQKTCTIQIQKLHISTESDDKNKFKLSRDNCSYSAVESKSTFKALGKGNPSFGHAASSLCWGSFQFSKSWINCHTTS